MDKVKSALGVDGKGQEGTEPVSGQEGKGTAEQPFDQGNEAGALPFWLSSSSCSS